MTKNQSFKSLLEVSIRRMHSALSAYYIWKWMDIAINLNNPRGKDYVEENLKIMSRHKDFFMQVKVSTYKSFVADISIFFDKNGYEDSFSLEKLIIATDDKLDEDQINQIRKKIEIIKKKHGIAIGLINKLRNADVAHQEINSQPRYLLYENIEDLFLGIQEILNLIDSKYQSDEYMWKHIEPEINRQMDWVFEDLRRGEINRLEEIEKKALIELEKLKRTK